jgi:hypothetical protein
MNGACSTFGGEEKLIVFWWGSLNERDHVEDPGVDGKVILIWIFTEWDVGAWTV